MSGIHRFLSKRDEDRNQSRKHHFDRQHGNIYSDTTQKALDPSSPADFYGLFESKFRPSPSEDQKLRTLHQKILEAKRVEIRDGAILWALHSHVSTGDIDGAYHFLLALSDASEGLVRNFDPAIRLKGAQNRQGVTCFLDSVLFAMFSRLDSFEAMLYNDFKDLPRNKLSFLLRLWVNMLRSGQLITVDITEIIQDAIAECGWDDAARLHQQDASEAFSFITGKLELPLLTLKMDIYHTGREDANDDHKFINERLLEVAIPVDPNGDKKETTLEDCLEDYFNNRIEVRRYLARRSTIDSKQIPNDKEKASAIHVESIEVDPDSSPSTPISSSAPVSSSARPPNKPRGQSIIQERFVPARGESNFPALSPAETRASHRSRTGSIRKEVMMPAWQFFSLIPWYTDNAPSNDAQVAAHFSSKRPVVGLCLKRYAMHKGRAIRLNTFVDIPTEIGLPHFMQDDQITDHGSLIGSFKLSLQSVVCHRGSSVDSGHYIALVRSTTTQGGMSNNAIETSKHWMRFDDLAHQRVTPIDIESALREETPYLLFYQIVPVETDSADATSGEQKTLTSASASSTTLRPPSSHASSSSNPSFEFPIRGHARRRSSLDTSKINTNPLPEAANVIKHNGQARTSLDTSRPSSRRISGDFSSQTPSRMNDGTTVGAGLSRHISKNSQTQNQIPEASEPVEVTVRQLSDAPSVPAVETQNQQNMLDVNIQRTHRRDRSKNRLLKGGKSREKPDRECAVM